MTQASNDILLEIVRHCSENKIGVVYTQYGNNVNKIEETTIHGERMIEIQIGDSQKEGFNELLQNFLNQLKG